MSPGPGPKLGPGTHEHPGVRSYIAPVNCRRQEGQIVPALVMLMLALVVIGLLFFKVARAALFPPRAQTAADAAALAAAKNVKDQLYRQMATTGTADPELIDPAEVNAAAAGYADKNDAHLTRAVELHGVDVKVWAATNDSLGENARPVDQQDTKAEARARARVEFSVLSGGGGSLPSIGSMGGGGDPTISDKEWNKLRKEISDPPTCGNDAASNDLVTLGKLLQKHGFQVGENADFGTPVGKHDEHGFHYRCRNSAAIDVNHDGAGQAAENAAINPLVKTLNDLGFRTIWQAEGHFDHIHIDVARSGNVPLPSMGAGFGAGGYVGALEEATLVVKLIDWDAPLETFYGFGGVGGGFFGGPPSAAVAKTICKALDRVHAGPKVRLSAFEAAIVESGVHNLHWGDRDSLGAFQQRANWGSVEERLDPEYAAAKYVAAAMRVNADGQSAGWLAQEVQGSAYPYRYDAVSAQAYALHDQFCGGPP